MRSDTTNRPPLEAYRLPIDPATRSSSFPAWLIRWDPTLEGALTNPLFVAFEERRNRQGSHHSALMRQTKLSRSFRLMRTVIVLGALGVLATVSLPLAMLGAAVGFLVRLAVDQKSDRLPVLPSTLTELVASPPEPGMLRDVWLTPFPAKIPFEALVLEARVGTWLWVLVSTVLLGLVPMCAGLANIQVSGMPVLWADILVVAAWFLLLAKCVVARYWAESAAGSSAAIEILRTRAAAGDFRRTMEDRADRYGRRGGRILIAISAPLLVIVLVGTYMTMAQQVAGYVAAGVDALGLGDARLMREVEIQLPRLLLAGLIGLGAALLHYLTSDLRVGFEATLRQHERDAKTLWIQIPNSFGDSRG